MSMSHGATGVIITQTAFVWVFFPIFLWSTQLSNPLKVNHFTELHPMISKQMPKARKYFSTSISFHVSLSLMLRKN